MHVLVGVPCAASLFLALLHGYEGSWYPLSTIIHQPQLANAAFGYRLLFPAMARFVEFVYPNATDHNAFVAVQGLVIIATTYLSGEWAHLFLPRFGRPLGYVLLTIMLSPTISYWTFYDIAIVGFWIASLLSLYHGRWRAYLLIFALATLNHENILVLVPVSVLYATRRLGVREAVLLGVAQIIVYASLRYLVIHGLHGAGLWDYRLPQNLLFWRTYPARELIYAWIVLIPWWVLAARGWLNAPTLVRCSTLALPGLILVTTLFGKYDEARQFDAFIPVCIALIACRIRRELNPAAIAVPAI